jgi:hypothetical protein
MTEVQGIRKIGRPVAGMRPGVCRRAAPTPGQRRNLHFFKPGAFPAQRDAGKFPTPEYLASQSNRFSEGWADNGGNKKAPRKALD